MNGNGLDQSEKVFEKYIRVGLSEQAQIVGDKILAFLNF